MTALKSIKTQAYQIVFWQLIIMMGLAIVVFLLQGMRNGLSTLLGGLAYWLPTCLFVWRVMSRATVRAVQQFVFMFFAGEAIKLFLSAVLFLIAIKYLSVSLPYGMMGFIGAIIAFWITSVFFLSRRSGVEL